MKHSIGWQKQRQCEGDFVRIPCMRSQDGFSNKQLVDRLKCKNLWKKGVL